MGMRPKANTYASVVSRESVRIAFLYAALNDLDVLSCDITNAYLNAPCTEKLWYEAGKEFGSDAGSVMILKKAVYGLRSAGNSSWATLSQSLIDIGYKPTMADPNVYQRRAIREGGEPYYEWLLCYVDDLLVVSAKPQETMDAISKTYNLRDSVKPPERYLGANTSKWQLPDCCEVWSMSGKDYLKNAINVAKEMASIDGLTFSSGKKAERPMGKDYRPEIDVSPPLEPNKAQQYQQLIGMLRWAVELGRVDILFEVSLLSSHLALPREGHLDAAYGIFGYLAKHLESNLVFDDKQVDTDWINSVYGHVEEERPPRMPEPLGKAVKMTCFVDASHAGDLVTRRSHTGFIIYLNNAPIDWYSKRQNTVETSTFGSELVAMKTGIEKVKALRIKLQLLGIPIEGPSLILGDNESVIKSTSRVEARLDKKHQSICWHAIREAAAAGWVKIGKEPTKTNTADLFTKCLEIPKRRQLLSNIFPKILRGGTK